jgi:ligand-binding SRPBCC domain-containing protein
VRSGVIPLRTMPTLKFSTKIQAPQAALWRFHDGVDALTKITPPGTRVRLLDPPEHLAQGVAFTLVVSQPPIYLPLRWHCEFIAYEPPLRFVDRQTPGRGPFAHWEHEHRFEAVGPHESLLIDTISYTPPLGPLGRLADVLFLRRQLTAMFAYRHSATKHALEAL